MNAAKKKLIHAIESVTLQVLDGNKGKSNTKTSIFHGAIEDYIKSRRKGIQWKHEETIENETGDWTFDIDMFATGGTREIAVLLKNPMRSMGKNRNNSTVGLWGEGVRISFIGKDRKKPLSILWISIHPTIDIVVGKKNAQGKGTAKIVHNYKPHSIETHNEGYALIDGNNMRFRYVGIPFDYAVSPTLKTLDGIFNAFKAVESGKRIIIKKETWQALDDAIDWLLEGF